MKGYRGINSQAFQKKWKASFFIDGRIFKKNYGIKKSIWDNLKT